MPVNNVSFGSVIAVSGKASQVYYLNNRVRRYNTKAMPILVEDVTQNYKNMSPSGMLAKTAQNGDKVQIYITGDDVLKFSKEVPEWDTLEGVLSNLCHYINLRETSVKDAVNEIYNS